MACWLGIALIFSMQVRAQSFDYSFSTSTGTYQSLGGATTIASDTNWNNSRFRIPIGFNFEFCEEAFDSVTIETNGFAKFDDNRAIVLFHGAMCKQDSNNVYSLLSYSTTGTPGNKIMKIQYTNCGYDVNDPGEYLNYQLWLYEQDNKVEIRTGTASYPGAIDSTGASPTPLIGLLNPLQNNTVNGLLLSGNATSPSLQLLSQGSILYYLDFIPAAGRIYTFVPNGN